MIQNVPYPDAEGGEALEAYLAAHSDPEPSYLAVVNRRTHVRMINPRMMSGHLQGRLLAMLSHMVRPRRVLELGTFSGYSALCMAKGMAPGGVVHTFEVNDEQEEFTRPWLEGSPYPARVEMHIGDVLELLPAMDLTFDMAFIDGNKRQYCNYYELVMSRLRPGGYILADNTLWDGHVADPAYDHDAQTLGIRRFNDRVARDGRVEKVILPLRDGLTLIRRIP